MIYEIMALAFILCALFIMFGCAALINCIYQYFFPRYMSDEELAEKLETSVTTVKTHRRDYE